MKTILRYAIIILIPFLFSHCASIVHGNKQIITFRSQPPGARIYIDEKESGITPKFVQLRRIGRFKNEGFKKKSYAIRIEMDGYYPYEINIKRNVDGWFFGNVLIGGLIGIIIDASTGAMYQLTPDEVVSPLSQKTAMIGSDADQIYIAVEMNPENKGIKIGELEKELF